MSKSISLQSNESSPDIHAVKPMQDYRLHLVFKNGEERMYDCKWLLEMGVFKELKHEGYFNGARVSDGAVAWPNGQDLSPDTLYFGSKTAHSSAHESKQ